MGFTKAACVGTTLLLLGACSQAPVKEQQLSTVEPGGVLQEGAMPSQNPYLLDVPPVSKRVHEAFAEAISAMQAKQWSKAEQRFLAMVEAWPDLSGPSLNLGIVYLAQDRDADASEAFARAIEANGNNLDAYNHLAALKRNEGDFAAAELLYEQALSIWPDHAASHLNLGILYDIYMGRFELAATHYEAYQALQGAPDRRVAGWLADLNRRPQMLARSESNQ